MYKYICLHLLFKRPSKADYDVLPTIAVIGGSPSILDNKIFIAKAFAHPENKAPKLGVAFNFVLQYYQIILDRGIHSLL